MGMGGMAAGGGIGAGGGGGTGHELAVAARIELIDDR
jgi:hypothetical protein